MSVILTINGQSYDYPERGDQNWGPDATDWASAVTTGMLQKAGGLFQLLAEADFGTSYGIKSLYYKSRTTNPASAGQVRLARADVISWRNQANSADLDLSVNASNALLFNGTALQGGISVSDTSTIDLTFAADTLSAAIVSASITNAMISASAAIAFSKLATLTSANILVGNGSNVATAVAVTGDISLTNAGVTAIGANKVTNAMLAQVSTATFKGRTTASTGNVEDLTVAQATAMLNAFVGDSGSGGTKGLVPAPGTGDAAKYLSGAGTFSTPPGAGDVVGPASSTDSGFARFDGLTGKLLKNSPATITNADVIAAAGIVYSKLNLTGGIVNADVNASAGIAFSKLAATTTSRALVSDVSGFVSVAATTAQEISYVNGVTSAIQTQIDTKLNASLGSSDEISNLTLTNSVGSSALTIAVKTKAATDASATDVIRVGMRNATAATGTYNQRTITAALSMVVSSGSTLGQSDAVAYPVHVYLIDNAGALELAVSTAFIGWSGIVSTTAEGGAGAADSNRVMYSTTARSNVPYRCIGRLTTTQTTAGTWAAAATTVDLTPFIPARVIALYASNSGQTLGAQAIYNYEDKLTDNYNCVAIGAGWAFTAPKSGQYRIQASITTGSVAWSLNNSLTLNAFINGSQAKTLGRLNMQAAATFDAFVNGHQVVSLTAGQTLDVRITSSQSVAATAGQDGNQISIVEIL